jgi:hypothetical protein
MPNRPLLILPNPVAPLDRIKTQMFGGNNLSLPGRQSQAERFNKRFQTLLAAFVAEAPEGVSSENLLVLETKGRIEGFKKAVAKIPGLEWQGEVDIDEVESDPEFFERPRIGSRFFKERVFGITARESKRIHNVFQEQGLVDKYKRLSSDATDIKLRDAIPTEFSEYADDILVAIQKEKSTATAGRLYLSLSNRRTLQEIKRLFDVWQVRGDDPKLTGEWRGLFSHLHAVRYWDVEDRLGDTGVLDYWEKEVQLKKGTASTVDFHIELAYSEIGSERRRREDTVRALVANARGSVLARCELTQIRYHALRVEVPVKSVELALERKYEELFTSGSVVYFAPSTQCRIEPMAEGVEGATRAVEAPEGPPVIALLDGLPFSRHRLLEKHAEIDDPDDFQSAYTPQQMRHGTAMASLICHSELDANATSLSRKIYIRPIMKPDQSPGGVEVLPRDVFFEDLLERAVKRMYEGEGDEPATASSVRIINLSVCDTNRPFHRFPSPLARLVDWLSYKYGVLFNISAGNIPDDLRLGVSAQEFLKLNDEEKLAATMKGIAAEKRNRTVVSPAEAINALTVGALHDDWAPVEELPDAVDVVPDRALPSPISALGPGFRGSVKPDVFFPGGRQLWREQGGGIYECITSARGPGHKVASAPVAAGEVARTVYTRGTSNATALVSRAGGVIHDVLVEVFSDKEMDIPESQLAPLLKALLVHGASWDTRSETLANCLGLKGISKKRELARYLGYGVPDFDRVVECTATRATAIGFGSIEKDERHEYRFPLPLSLSGGDKWRRLTITLAWISPINPGNRNYRRAALSFDSKTIQSDVGGSRTEADWQQVKTGTVQHEVIEGTDVVVYQRGSALVIAVQCREDAGPLDVSTPYGLAVTLEVKEDVDIPVYDEVKEAIEVAILEQVANRIR